MALVVKKLPANAGDTGDVSSIPGWERSPGGGCGNPLQYSCLENPMDIEEPVGLMSMGSQGVRYDRSDLAHTHQKRKESAMPTVGRKPFQEKEQQVWRPPGGRELGVFQKQRRLVWLQGEWHEQNWERSTESGSVGIVAGFYSSIIYSYSMSREI